MPFSQIATHFTLKMEASRSFKNLVSYYYTTWSHNPEDLNMNIRFLFFKKENDL
jgi:hypothetical protein